MKVSKWLSHSSDDEPEPGSKDDKAGDQAIRLMKAHNSLLPRLEKQGKTDPTAAKAAKNIRDKGGRSDGARNDGRS